MLNTTNEDLKSALKTSLEERGVLNSIKALMRKSIFDAIDIDNYAKPKIPEENLIINEMIKEYLKYNNYNYSNQVFQSETGQPENPFDRDYIEKELNINTDKTQNEKPLLYFLLKGLKEETYEPINKNNNNNNNEIINTNNDNTNINKNMNIIQPEQIIINN
jgi:lisH domain-containing protein FOPNL